MGIFAVDRLGRGQLHRLQGLQGQALPLRSGKPFVNVQNLLHLGADLHQGVHGAHRLLKYHADLPALDPPQLGAGDVKQFPSVQQNLAGVVAPAPGQQPRHAHGGDGLAGAGLPYQAQNFAVMDGEGHPRHGLPVPAVKFHV